MRFLPSRFPGRPFSWTKLLVRSFLALVVLYLVLLIPDSEPHASQPIEHQPFVWNQDELWSSLEQQFSEARASGCSSLISAIDRELSELRQLLESISSSRARPDDLRFQAVEDTLFRLSPKIAACPDRLREFMQIFVETRYVTKRQSEHWEMNSLEVRQRMYRLIYGGRAAVEEVVLQANTKQVPVVLTGREVLSKTPSVEMLGMTIHSGDMLLSRGAASYSALIARGHDYPGNFSHVALVHIDGNRTPSFIEAHIIGGVAVHSLEDYLKDRPLRIAVLRLRHDLPQLRSDPMLAHKAAALALQDATSRHIPYDLEMNHSDHSAQFCSEVVSTAYEAMGIHLWTAMSYVSAPGIRAWLTAAGVRHFETQEPSDLEYDPQLDVVAEWRDPESLFQDHVDNAVIEVMLEDADRGERLEYRPLMLPFARMGKAFSMVVNLFGKEGPIPEVMSATVGLQFLDFDAKHGAIKAGVLSRVSTFEKQRGYRPPYWELLNLTRSVKADLYPLQRGDDR